MGGQSYSAEFRRMVLDLVDQGHPVAKVAQDFDICDQTIYAWRRRDRADGKTPQRDAERLAAARKRLQTLESELAAARREVRSLRALLAVDPSAPIGHRR